MSTQPKSNRMGTEPVNKLMLSMGVPMILSMMMQALYNIVDSAFVSNMKDIGEAALNALTLAFPVQMLMVAISVGTGVGTNALMSKCLGRKDPERASRVAGNAEFLGILIMSAFMLFGIFLVPAYVRSQSENPEIISMAVSYLRICCIISAGIVFFTIMEKTLQATGLSTYSTIAQVSGALTNIILDPILIYGLLGFPELKVIGAALATVIGQIVSFVLALAFHLTKNKEIKNGISYMKPDKNLIRGIYSIGLPAIIAQALMSMMTYGLNLILVRVDEAAVTAYGLYYKIQQFILFAAFGLRDAITPIVSFNHGMQDRGRIKDGIKYGLLYTCVVMLAGTILLEAFAGPLSSVFGLSGTTQDLCTGCMRIISLSLVFAGANVAFQGVFQALDAGPASLAVSICRQALFVLPVAYGFSLVARADISRTWMIWLTFIIAEGASLLISVLFMKRINKDKLAKLG